MVLGILFAISGGSSLAAYDAYGDMSIAYMGAGAIFYILMMLYCLAVLLPSLSLMVRRLHDIGKSGTYILMGLIPVVGYIFILVYMLTGSAPDNQYGPKKSECDFGRVYLLLNEKNRAVKDFRSLQPGFFLPIILIVVLGIGEALVYRQYIFRLGTLYIFNAAKLFLNYGIAVLCVVKRTSCVVYLFLCFLQHRAEYIILCFARGEKLSDLVCLFVYRNGLKAHRQRV